MSRKVELFLLPSAKMSRQKEHNHIRFPKRARTNFGFSNSTVVVGKGESRTALRVHRAYTIDISRLAQMVGKRKISAVEAKSVGFVSRAVYNGINRKEGDSLWISNGIEEITIGADPEFGLVLNNGEHDFLTRGDKVINKAGKFGSDGPGVEIRPEPSIDHNLVVGNIQSILRNPPDAVKPYAWRGGATFTDPSRTYWFGGHVHLGRPATIDVYHADYCYSGIAAALDHLLAFPLMRFDTPGANLRRNGCNLGYGKAGTGDTEGADASIRTNYPNMDRFEYRVLSGLWLTHPVLARIVLGTAKCIAETAYNRIADKEYDYDWVQKPVSQDGLAKSFGLSAHRPIVAAINANRSESVTTDKIRSWEKQIRDLDRFDVYATELQALIQLVKENPHQVISGLSLNIRKNWEEGTHLLSGKPSKALTTALEAVEG